MNYIFLFAFHSLLLNALVGVVSGGGGESFNLGGHLFRSELNKKQNTGMMSTGRFSIVDRLFNAFKYVAGKNNKIEKNMSNIFQPKFVETPTEEDYTQSDEYYQYEYAYDYDKGKDGDGGGGLPQSDNNQTSNGFIKTTTSSPRSTTKNQTLPSKFNLNSIFDFAQYILRPTSQYENTIEVLNRHKTVATTSTSAPVSNEEHNLNEQENFSSSDVELAAADGSAEEK
jgi:hypothetical protein